MSDSPAILGDPLQILSDPRPVAPLPDRPGWLRVHDGGRVTLLPTEAIIGVEAAPADMPHGPARTWIHRRDGLGIFVGDMDPLDVLAAIDEADGEGPGAAPLPPPDAVDLLAKVIERRAVLHRVMVLADRETTPPPVLGVLRDHALHLATHISHPRDWLLLLRDACFEAAAELTNADLPIGADRFIALGQQLERDARRQPVESFRA